MFRSRGENLRAIFILLFLNIAFFLLEHQDPKKYARLFRFDWNAIQNGEVWRVVTWQFTQAGEGWIEALALFVTLLLLYMMGTAIEEEWGTFHFLMLFAISTLASAATAAWLGVPLLGTYFVYFTLLFIYGSAFPQQTLYLLGMIPVRVRFIALCSFGLLLYGVFTHGGANIAALAGAVAAYVYYVSTRVTVRFVTAEEIEVETPPVRIDTTAIHNATRYQAIKRALAARSDSDLDRLLGHCDREIKHGVNICPPADYKPENGDGYCIRCEGFAECSARYVRSVRPAPAAAAPPLAIPNPDAS